MLLFCLLSVIVTLSAFACFTVSRISALRDALEEFGQFLDESEVEKMRANLLRAISHDLRAPLAAIISSSSLYLEHWQILDEQKRTDLITGIFEEANWLLTIVENLLAITRIGESSISIATREEPLEEVIASAIQKAKKLYPDLSVVVRMPDDYILLPMDAILIEQVILNLLANAALHSASASPVEIIISHAPHGVSITVKDYGCGISPEKIGHLFDPTYHSGAYHAAAYRTDARHSAAHPSDAHAARAAGSHKSAGIGLSICKTIISAHHGTILGRNHKSGAEFIFTLPYLPHLSHLPAPSKYQTLQQ